jgi:hypothetical protein
MSLKKLRRGVLHVETSAGLRCIELTAVERIKLLWIFRNFSFLPEAVLGEGAKGLLQSLLTSDRSQLRCANNHAEDDDYVIGTVESVVKTKKKNAKGMSKRPAKPAMAPDAPGLGSRVVS